MPDFGNPAGFDISTVLSGAVLVVLGVVFGLVLVVNGYR